MTDRAWTDAEIVASYIEQVEHDEREVMSGPLPTTDLLTLFDTCQKEADYHTAVGLYGHVPFEEVFEKRVTEWLAEHDAALIEGLADELEGGFNSETLNRERREIKRWLREKSRQRREEQGS